MNDLGINRQRGRSAFEIMRDILVYTQTPRTISNIKTKMRMNTAYSYYIDLLIEFKLLEPIIETFKGRSWNSKTKRVLSYHTTQKGFEYVSALNVALSYIGIKKPETEMITV